MSTQPRPEQSDSRWVVTAFDFGPNDIHECALVTAPNEEEAALIGADLIQESWRCTDGMEDRVVDKLFVGPWPRVAYTMTWHAEAAVADWQCCGGPNDEGGHYGGCPTRIAEGSCS